jgi:hypothetical protein
MRNIPTAKGLDIDTAGDGISQEIDGWRIDHVGQSIETEANMVRKVSQNRISKSIRYLQSRVDIYEVECSLNSQDEDEIEVLPLHRQLYCQQ